jgi:hypothetical protein
MWYIYKNGANQYTVCQGPSGGYTIYCFGPNTYAACAAKMKEWGIPGW